jgi:redox-regulated HSP33 family molecular chaperone
LFSNPNNSGFFRDALEKGNYLGVIASSDHKSTHVSFAMVYAEEFSRQGIMDGIKKRHTYGATDNIVLDVRMNGCAMMGDVIKADERRINIYVHGTGKIKDIVLVKDGKEYPLKHSGKKKVKVEWVDENKNENESYYYVRVMQEDGELAWSSPIWIK